MTYIFEAMMRASKEMVMICLVLKLRLAWFLSIPQAGASHAAPVKF